MAYARRLGMRDTQKGDRHGSTTDMSSAGGKREAFSLTLDEEFLRNAHGQCTVPDFPQAGHQTTLTWEERLQKFVITAAH